MAKCSKCEKEGEFIGGRFSLSIINDKFVCDECRGGRQNSMPIVGRTFFDVTTGEEISTSDINKICKERGLVYGDDKDLSKDCECNRKHTEEKQMSEFRNIVIENTMRELA
jgi:hypothetical protein